MRRILLGLLIALPLAGCYNQSQRLYQRAEAFFTQGQYYLAANDYRRLVMEQPRSVLADDALYKLGFIYQEEMNSPPRAIQCYELLADRYPNSNYADDALLRVLQIQIQDLKDVPGARRTCDLIRQRFPDRPRVQAIAQLQLANMLFDDGRLQEADGEARELIAAYPAQERQVAAALLVRARVAQKTNNKSDQAIKIYEQVVHRYPHTMSAVEAKQSIGWLYYGYRSVQMKQERLAKERAARVIDGVPPVAAEDWPQAKPFACLASLLAQRGVKVDAARLMAVSGAAFEFYYDPKQPQATAETLGRNTLTNAAQQYGFAVNVWSAPSAEASFANLVQSVEQGQPVMVPQQHSSDWFIVTGYKPAQEQIFVVDQGNKAQPLKHAAFLARWASTVDGHSDCVTGPYFQLSLGLRRQTPTAAAMLRNALRRAVDALRERENNGTPAGQAAYDALIAQIAGQPGSNDAASSTTLGQWATQGLPALLADRQAAADYLATAVSVAPAEQRAAIGQAAAACTEEVSLGSQLRHSLQLLTTPQQGGPTPLEVSWSQAADQARQMKAAEDKVLSRLSQTVR